MGTCPVKTIIIYVFNGYNSKNIVVGIEPRCLRYETVVQKSLTRYATDATEGRDENCNDIKFFCKFKLIFHHDSGNFLKFSSHNSL